MQEAKNPYIDDPNEAEVGRLVDQGFTYAQARERIYGPNAQEPEKTNESGGSGSNRTRRTISRTHLSSMGKLTADDTPESVAQDAVAQAGVDAARQLLVDSEQARQAGKEILDRLKGSGSDQSAA